MCSTNNFLSMLHVWLITCWKWWIFTFPAEYIISTLGHSSNQIFFGSNYIFWLPGQLLTVKKTKPKKSPICVYSRWKKMCAIAHIGNTSAKTILFFYLFNTDTNTVTAELFLGRMDPGVGSGQVTILPDFGGSGRVSTSDLLVFHWLFLGTWIDMNLRILSNTTFGLIDFHRYLIYNNYLINK